MTRKYYKISVQDARLNRGFSLFELILYLLIASIIFSVSMNRFENYPGDAERANFLSILGQVKAAVMIQMMTGLASQDASALDQLENSNPMDLMLEAPSNYTGAFQLVDEQSMPRRTWYFDSYNGYLVYLPSPSVTVYSQAGDGSTLNAIRFRIANKFSGKQESVEGGLGIDAGQVTGLSVTDSQSAEGGGNWEGLILEIVTPYQWTAQAITGSVEGIVQ
ncbi:MAG: type II secretion system protein [Pseudomonadota bacterium]